MYNHTHMGKVQLQTPTNENYQFPRHFSGENKPNVPQILILPGIH